MGKKYYLEKKKKSREWASGTNSQKRIRQKEQWEKAEEQVRR